MVRPSALHVAGGLCHFIGEVCWAAATGGVASATNSTADRLLLIPLSWPSRSSAGQRRNHRPSWAICGRPLISSGDRGPRIADFIKTGNPNGPGPSDLAHVRHQGGFRIMRLEVGPRAEPESKRARYLLVDSLR